MVGRADGEFSQRTRTEKGFSRPDETRLRNEHIAAAARLNRFDRQIAVPFICECSEHRCEELIRLTLGEFDAARIGERLPRRARAPGRECGGSCACVTGSGSTGPSRRTLEVV